MNDASWSWKFPLERILFGTTIFCRFNRRFLSKPVVQKRGPLHLYGCDMGSMNSKCGLDCRDVDLLHGHHRIEGALRGDAVRTDGGIGEGE